MIFFAFAVGAALQATPADPAVPTAIEHALMGYLCRSIRAEYGEGSDADLKCYNDNLAALRADFGRDLSRIRPDDRKTLDSACGQIDTERREAYLECLNAQLTAMRKRRSRGKPTTTATAAPSASTPASGPVVADDVAAGVPVATSRAAPGVPSTMLWIGAGVAAFLLLAGGFVMMRARRPQRACRLCGEPTFEGDMCTKCRHDAAEAARRTALQRSEAERIERERRQRLAQLEEEQLRERARRVEQARAQQDEEIQRLERLKVLRQDEEKQQRSRFGVASSEEAFDPRAVLGVAPDASRENIEAAYAAAKSRYDLNEVTHLGPELQEYYKAKAAAVERAFKALTD